MIITVGEAKNHLNIGEGFTDDDLYINDLILVAENAIETDIHRTFMNLVLELDIQRTLDGNAAELGTIPAVLKHAAKLMVGNFYANREPAIIGVSVTEMPLSYRYLVSKYKSYTVG